MAADREYRRSTRYRNASAFSLPVISVACGLTALFSLSNAQVAASAVLTVGKDQIYRMPSQAAAAAKDGDVVQIHSGTYSGDVCVWSASNLTIIGVGQAPVLDAQGRSVQGKAIWVINGANVSIENVEFTGCACSDRNGAGIRAQGGSLILKNCYFHDNQEGLLSSNSPAMIVTMQNCRFHCNGAGDGYSHNIYIGNIASFTMTNCCSDGAIAGHDVKSRAQKNFIRDNRIGSTRQEGKTLDEIDLPNGGDSYVTGNTISKSANAAGNTSVAYAAEGAKNLRQRLYIANNTFTTKLPKSIFIRSFGRPSLCVVDNRFFGNGTPVVADNSGYEFRHNVDAKQAHPSPAGLHARIAVQ